MAANRLPTARPAPSPCIASMHSAMHSAVQQHVCSAVSASRCARGMALLSGGCTCMDGWCRVLTICQSSSALVLALWNGHPTSLPLLPQVWVCALVTYAEPNCSCPTAAASQVQTISPCWFAGKLTNAAPAFGKQHSKQRPAHTNMLSRFLSGMTQTVQAPCFPVCLCQCPPGLSASHV